MPLALRRLIARPKDTSSTWRQSGRDTAIRPSIARRSLLKHTSSRFTPLPRRRRPETLTLASGYVRPERLHSAAKTTTAPHSYPGAWSGMWECKSTLSRGSDFYVQRTWASFQRDAVTCAHCVHRCFVVTTRTTVCRLSASSFPCCASTRSNNIKISWTWATKLFGPRSA
jgi:hypothetical protein